MIVVISVVVGIVLILLSIIAYLFFKGYGKIKGKALSDIPCPPMEHHMGHLEKMLSPLKHERRLAVCDAARSEVHQLVVVKHASIFVNSGKEATRILNEIVTKGPIYQAYRFFMKQPDLFSSDHEAWKARFDVMGDALNDITLSNEGEITKDLTLALHRASESGEPVRVRKLCSLLAFDVVAGAVFGYKLGAVSGSEEGEKLFQSLESLAEKQSGEGLYANPQARKITPEEEADAKATWKKFVAKCTSVLMTETETNSGSKAAAFGRALKAFATADAASFPEDEREEHVQQAMFAESHQIIRHGQEAIGGMLVWLLVCLHQWPEARQSLEKAIKDNEGKGDYPEYLECFIKETLRRYPTCGNMTVRTVDKEGFVAKGGYPIATNLPIFMHIFSLQNTGREWHKARDFYPERWLAANSDKIGVNMKNEPTPYAPKCPFASIGVQKAVSELKSSRAHGESSYSGLGHSEGSISYLPFGAGARTCLGRHLALQVMRKFLLDVARQYRLTPSEKPGMEVDPGAAVQATIVPMMESSTLLKVNRIKSGHTGLGADAKSVKKEETADDGWADDSDEEVPELAD